MLGVASLTGIVVLALLFLLYASASQQAQAKVDWKELLESGKEGERMQAAEIVLGDRREKTDTLLTILSSAVEQREPFYSSTTSRNIAISLLGKLRAAEAVRELTNWLMPKEGQILAVTESMMFSPAGYALAKIGLPSVAPLLEIIREKGCSSPEEPEKIRKGGHVWFKRKPGARICPLGDQCLKVIVAIKGVGETEFALKNAVEAETEPVKKENLKSAFDLLGAPIFPRDALERHRVALLRQ